MTEQQAKEWINKSVYSSDDKNVGTVTGIQRDANGRVTEIHADVGGFLGLGAQRVMLTPAQVRFDGDRVLLNMTSEQVKSLPKIAK
jgi:ribosomal 30S subunit maturation factor RimM